MIFRRIFIQWHANHLTNRWSQPLAAVKSTLNYETVLGACDARSRQRWLISRSLDDSALSRRMTDYSYPLMQQLAASLRKSPVAKIKKCLRLAEQHQIPITATELEGHHLAGGRITDVIDALILAKQLGMDLSVRRARVQDLGFGKTRSVKDWLTDCHRRGIKDLESALFP
jgi:hypothetical protein